MRTFKTMVPHAGANSLGELLPGKGRAWAWGGAMAWQVQCDAREAVTKRLNLAGSETGSAAGLRSHLMEEYFISYRPGCTRSPLARRLAHESR